MYDPQTIEIHEDMTISLASNEHQNATTDLIINVRIVWTPSEGIYAEPLTWRLGEGPRMKVGDRHSLQPMDLVCRTATKENYNDRTLAFMIHEPPFEGAQRYLMAEDAADRSWANRCSL